MASAISDARRSALRVRMLGSFMPTGVDVPGYNFAGAGSEERLERRA
jgi:hypothetical protein